VSVPDLETVTAEIKRRLPVFHDDRRTLVVGIDGRGGAGKSTLAERMGNALGDTTVVQFDDFYRPAAERMKRHESGDDEVGGDFDWRRIRDQVLKPLAVDALARYQRYDWDLDRLAEWHVVEPGGVVIVEGSYSTRPELRDFYELTIWVDAPHELRLLRGIQRDGEQARSRWLDEWMPEEDRYVAFANPEAHADFVLDGSTTLA
jgi:uridine kinase